MGSLQDALLKTGLAEDRPESSRSAPARGRKHRGPSRGKPESAGQTKKKVAGAAGKANGPANAGNNARKPTDLERAWAARRREEQADKERVKQKRLADQEARRRRNVELEALLKGRSLNVNDAELPRYFEHLGRIRRVMCTTEQRTAVNDGQLGIVNLRGRYWIVEPEVVAKWKEVAPDLVPDLTAKEPDEPDGYPPVPDDLTW